MKVIDAFAGLGGFSLAADALGWDTVAFVEWDKDCQFWLGEHWPNVPIYGDITTVRWEDAPRCDIFTAGFPCQPHSVAGKRAASDDSRDLWSECVRAISTLRPRYAVLENVPGLLTSESGRFFNRVLSDLAKIGYVGRYDVLSAADCGAPHRRERVWIVCWPSVADSRGERSQNAEGDASNAERSVAGAEESGNRRHNRSSENGSDMGNSNGGRCEQRDATIGRDAVVRAGRDSVGDIGSTGLQGHGRSDGEPVPAIGAGTRRHSATPSYDLRHPWADAIPYRGADGTVRLIPARAVANAERLSGREAATGGTDGTQRTATPRRSEGDGRGEEEVSRPEPALRVVADGIPHGLAGRHAAEEAKSWATPNERDWHAPGGDRTGHAQSVAVDVSTFGGTGGSLWPVTDSEPSRVARLKAVGNSVSPAWCLAGPFQFILDREGLRGTNPDID